jgi:DMSO/TMAO reductase YedYZ heme-binding membrane subunit
MNYFFPILFLTFFKFFFLQIKNEIYSILGIISFIPFILLSFISFFLAINNSFGEENSFKPHNFGYFISLMLILC